MIRELDTVALTVDLPEHGLTAGDVGAVVHVFKSGCDFEVEFVTFEGRTVAVVKLSSDRIRPLTAKDIQHARQFASAAR